MSVFEPGELTIASEDDIVAARRRVRDAAKAIGFGITDVTRIVTAVSELARNTHKYGGGGTVAWTIAKDGARSGIEITFADEGPGIADVERALEEGYTTGRGLGMGLAGSRRLMDEMDIDSEVGRGTTITIRKWRRGG